MTENPLIFSFSTTSFAISRFAIFDFIIKKECIFFSKANIDFGLLGRFKDFDKILENIILQ